MNELIDQLSTMHKNDKLTAIRAAEIGQPSIKSEFV